MTNKSYQDVRADFELWYSNCGTEPEAVQRWESGGYIRAHANDQWAEWQKLHLEGTKIERAVQ